MFNRSACHPFLNGILSESTYARGIKKRKRIMCIMRADICNISCRDSSVVTLVLIRSLIMSTLVDLWQFGSRPVSAPRCTQTNQRRDAHCSCVYVDAEGTYFTRSDAENLLLWSERVRGAIGDKVPPSNESCLKTAFC